MLVVCATNQFIKQKMIITIEQKYKSWQNWYRYFSLLSFLFLSFLASTRKWENLVFVFLCLLISHDLMSLSHLNADGRLLFFPWLNNILLRVMFSLIPKSPAEWPCWFHVLVAVNNTCINMICTNLLDELCSCNCVHTLHWGCWSIELSAHSLFTHP